MFKRLIKEKITLYRALNQILSNQITIMIYLKRECYLEPMRYTPHKSDFEHLSTQVESSKILSDDLKETLYELTTK